MRTTYKRAGRATEVVVDTIQGCVAWLASPGIEPSRLYPKRPFEYGLLAAVTGRKRTGRFSAMGADKQTIVDRTSRRHRMLNLDKMCYQ